MRDVIEKFAATIHMIEQHEGAESEIEDALEELMTRAPLVEAILESLEELPYRADPSSWGGHPGQAYLDYRPYCMRAFGKLRDRQLIASVQTPGPTLSATRLHPWVWDSAGSLWNSGHHRQAVSAAAGAISAQTQARLNRTDINDQQLMQDAFGVDAPAPGKTRLRVAADMSNKFDKGLQQGAGNLAQGVYGYIRNPATHETGEWAEQEALEKLTALSVVARIIEDAEILTTPSGPSVRDH